MSVTEDDIRLVGKLSRIAIEQDDLATYVSQVNQILELVNQLNVADTKNVTPMSHPLDLKARLRSDRVTETFSVTENKRSSSIIKDNLYIVPKVID